MWVRPLILQITVTSGGMLLMKLDTNDLQFEHFRHFDGQYAYAQNKVHSINVCVCLGTIVAL